MNIQLSDFIANKWECVNDSGFMIPRATSIAVTTQRKPKTPQIFDTLDLNFQAPLKISNLCSCAIFAFFED